SRANVEGDGAHRLPAAAETTAARKTDAAREAAAAPVVVAILLVLLLRRPLLIELRRVDDARDDRLARLEAGDDLGVHTAREADDDLALRRSLCRVVPNLDDRAARLHGLAGRRRAARAATAAVHARHRATAALPAAAAKGAAALTA